MEYLTVSCIDGKEKNSSRKTCLSENLLARIAKIKDMKAEVILKKQELLDRGVVTKMDIEIYTEKIGDTDSFTFDKILYVYVLDKLLRSGEISLEEGKSLLQTMVDNYKKFEGKNCELIFIRKMGISTFLLTLSPNEIYFEKSTKVVIQLNLGSCIEELKIKVGTL